MDRWAGRRPPPGQPRRPAASTPPPRVTTPAETKPAKPQCGARPHAGFQRRLGGARRHRVTPRGASGGAFRPDRPPRPAPAGGSHPVPPFRARPGHLRGTRQPGRACRAIAGRLAHPRKQNRFADPAAEQVQRSLPARPQSTPTAGRWLSPHSALTSSELRAPAQTHPRYRFVRGRPRCG